MRQRRDVVAEVRRGDTRQQLASGEAHGPAEVKVGPFDGIAVRAGDVISLSIGPRDGNHSCDLTAIDLKITGKKGDARQTWNLAERCIRATCWPAIRMRIDSATRTCGTSTPSPSRRRDRRRSFRPDRCWQSGKRRRAAKSGRHWRSTCRNC